MTTILLVDDSHEIRDVVSAVLEDEGFMVITADRAERALSLLAHTLPDLVILDGRLPGMSGWQCLALLRAADRTARLPVLMLTAAADDLERAQKLPPDDCTTYLAKPFDIDDLLAMMLGVIETCNKETVAA